MPLAFLLVRVQGCLRKCRGEDEARGGKRGALISFLLLVGAAFSIHLLFLELGRGCGAVGMRGGAVGVR